MSKLPVDARPRKHDLVRVAIRDHVVEEAFAYVDAISDVVEFFEAHMPTVRSRKLVRPVLAAMWLVATTQRSLHLNAVPELLGDLDPALARRHGLINDDNEPISYKQILRVWHHMADMLDPSPHGAGRELDDETRTVRARELQWVLDRMCAASMPPGVHPGSYSVDTTLKWAWARPPGSSKAKVDRTGSDGEGRPPLSLHEMIDDGDLSDAGIEPGPNDPTPAATSTSGTAQKSGKTRPSKDPDATWVGRKNVAKAVFGYGYHLAVRLPETKEDDVPCVVERMVITHATANPAATALPMFRRLHDDRDADDAVATTILSGSARVLGDVSADLGFTMMKPADWHLPLRALGANPIFRLHRTNQAGRRAIHRNVEFIDGEPTCSCLPDDLAELHFPAFPSRLKTIERYQQLVQLRRPFQYRPNGRADTAGRRQYLAPHHRSNLPGGAGGCEHCTMADGSPVIDPTTGEVKRRCCTKATVRFTADELALTQEPTYGTPEWFDRWHSHNRVEGFNGILKNLGVTNLRRDWHHYMGIARESLAGAFAVVATNYHLIRHWRARQQLADRARGGRPRDAGIERFLPARDVVLDTSPSENLTPARTGPLGLPGLGQPRAGP